MFGAWLSLVERLVRDQEAGGSNPLAPTKYPSRFQKHVAELRDLAQSIQIGTVPSFVPTLRHSRTFHRRQHGLRLRVDVPLGRREIAVASEIAECVRVHMCGPSCEAGVPESVQREARDLGDRVRFRVRFL